MERRRNSRSSALSNQSFNVNSIYQTNDESPEYDPAGYVKNGIFTQLTNDGGDIDQNGAFILSVSTGDIYGFYVDSTDGCCGRADIFVTALAASETPLPAALPLFATGLGALGLLGWRRKRKQAAVTTNPRAKARGFFVGADAVAMSAFGGKAGLFALQMSAFDPKRTLKL